MTKRLLVECDYHAFPLWRIDETTGIHDNDPADVAISDDLRRDLQLWAHEWSRESWPELRHLAPTPPEDWYVHWWKRGQALVDRLRAEVGSDWAVEFGHPPTPVFAEEEERDRQFVRDNRFLLLVVAPLLMGAGTFALDYWIALPREPVRAVILGLLVWGLTFAGPLSYLRRRKTRDRKDLND